MVVDSARRKPGRVNEPCGALAMPPRVSPQTVPPATSTAASTPIRRSDAPGFGPLVIGRDYTSPGAHVRLTERGVVTIVAPSGDNSDKLAAQLLSFLAR